MIRQICHISVKWITYIIQQEIAEGPNALQLGKVACIRQLDPDAVQALRPASFSAHWLAEVGFHVLRYRHVGGTLEHHPIQQ